jgi:opacity protein-like surface antigen
MREDTPRRRAAVAVVAALVTLASAAVAAGQPAGDALAVPAGIAAWQAAAAQVRRGPAPAPEIGARGWGAWKIRLFGEVDVQAFSASHSFDAITGSSAGLFYGGGVDLSIGRRLLVVASVTHFQKTGERAFVYNGEAFPLGVPLRLSVTPITASLAYRFAGTRRLRPYVGAGVGVVLYRETSDYSGPGEDVSTSGTAVQAIGGVEIPIARRLSLAVEGRYQSVRGILGDQGVSQAFGEKDLGGASLGVRLIVGK